MDSKLEAFSRERSVPLILNSVTAFISRVKQTWITTVQTQLLAGEPSSNFGLLRLTDSDY